MKFFLKKLVIFLFFFSITKGIYAQALADSAAVVITAGTDNKSIVDQVKVKIKSLTNINYVGYCSNHNVFMLYIDTQYHGSPELFLSHLKKSTGIISIQLKEGSISDIINFCQFNDATDYEKNKTAQSH